MDFLQLLNAVDFTDFAKAYISTRDDEWEKDFPRLKSMVEGEAGTPSGRRAKEMSKLLYEGMKMANNLDIAMLQKYHFWLLKSLYETFPILFENT